LDTYHKILKLPLLYRTPFLACFIKSNTNRNIHLLPRIALCFRFVNDLWNHITIEQCLTLSIFFSLFLQKLAFWKLFLESLCPLMRARLEDSLRDLFLVELVHLDHLLVKKKVGFLLLLTLIYFLAELPRCHLVKAGFNFQIPIQHMDFLSSFHQSLLTE